MLVLEIFGRGMPPASLNNDTISDQKCYFPNQILDLASKIQNRFHTWPGLLFVEYAMNMFI